MSRLAVIVAAASVAFAGSALAQAPIDFAKVDIKHMI